MRDWTQPPLVERPGDLGPVLVEARLIEFETDRAARRIRLRFALPTDAGLPEAVFTVEEATHRLAYAYLPPVAPLKEGLSAEETMAQVGDWARQGLIVTFDPGSAETPLIVTHARLHTGEEGATLSVEGYGEDPERIVWWEVRVAGRSIEPEPPAV